MRLLVAEDDAVIAEFVAQGLREAGFAVDVAATGPAGLQKPIDRTSGLNWPDAKAVIVATTNLTPEEEKYYRALRKKGVIVATSFPSGAHVASSVSSAEPTPPARVSVKHLMPTKARILMMLALTRTQQALDIQKIFDSY